VSNSKKILIVDDNKDLADGLAMVLAIEGYDADVVYTGKDAASRLNNVKYDIAFVDIKMPDISGLHLFRVCKKSALTKFIFMTGFRIEQIVSEIFPRYLISITRESDNEEYEIDKLLHYDIDEIKIYIGNADRCSAKISEYCSENNINIFTIYNASEIDDEIIADVIVVNIHKPLIDVVVLLDEIKERLVDDPVILILIDYDNKSENIVSLNSYSLTGCLFKPIKPETILTEVNNVL